jgi:hypothetical protein
VGRQCANRKAQEMTSTFYEGNYYNEGSGICSYMYHFWNDSYVAFKALEVASKKNSALWN